MFGDARPRCLGMLVPDVWGWASRGSNYFIKKFLWKNYLKKCFLNIIYGV